jgi:hypothetical protein
MAQLAPMEQVLSSQFRLLYRLLEASDGLRHKHTTKHFRSAVACDYAGRRMHSVWNRVSPARECL